ncbi:DUF294 nucleotidyltransferase-like domain-containing protein [Ectothiorhodospira lacustris]|uniref:DUF294 nucleotidyltransferase-like domain-containing protein n=1 Tax=Ectothiorhodospira lacustris TaxID=2899127 RepID=UPI001EE849D8|nr:DUF294 nucleotidyltransferase-like domain-containing protein [Ectothiorhodospira lacustris]MCG5499982.1 DUF294 nucleotidyltransferase-like domain-containing protein [Ectothiorhodospira lacustris]
MDVQTLISQVKEAETRHDLEQLGRRLPALQIQLIRAGVNADELGHIISDLADAFTGRFIHLAEVSLGPAPMPYAWVACGSQGRREQTVHTDQDNALILSGPADRGVSGYFDQLAEQVTTGLDACGFVLCSGEVMARNPKWRQPLDTWESDFKQWIEQPERKSVMLAQNFLDLRCIHGEADLLERLRRRILALTRHNAGFMAALAVEALHDRPPRRLPGDWLTVLTRQAPLLNIKRVGILPIVSLARLLALADGVMVLGTRERLQAAVDSGRLSEAGGRDLTAAWDCITLLRAQHQVRCLEQGRKADNRVAVDTLSQEDRQRLREAFKMVRIIQSTTGRRVAGFLLQ